MGRPKVHKEGFNFNEYYKQNKERINRRRRERYKADPSYRKRVKQMNSVAYMNRRGDPKDRRVIKNKKGQFFSMGVLAANINRQSQTVRDYHRQGLLPDPLYYDTRGWRLYDEKQVVLARKLFKKYDLKEISKETLMHELRKGWGNVES